MGLAAEGRHIAIARGIVKPKVRSGAKRERHSPPALWMTRRGRELGAPQDVARSAVAASGSAVSPASAASCASVRENWMW